MIPDFESLCLYTYVVVEDILQALAGPGARECSDGELLTMILVGEACSWTVGTEMLSHWRTYPTLFPHVPNRYLLAFSE